MSLRDKIFQVQDLEEEELFIPEWDCTVLIRAMTGAARAKLLQDNMLRDGKPDLVKMYPGLAIASVRDPESKELVFTATDRDTLNTKSGAALERIATTAMRLNGLTPDVQKQEEQTF